MMLNNLLRCSTPIVILFFLCLNINCKKDAESTIQPCSIPGLKDYLSTDWVLTTTTWGVSDSGKRYDDCYDIDCIHFNLSFTSDSNYSLSYLIPNEITSDTFRLEETGTYLITFCNSSQNNVNGGHFPGPNTRRGEIEFQPNIGEAYSSGLTANGLYPLYLNGFSFGENPAAVFLEKK